MDPHSGQLYSSEARAALERQFEQFPEDRALRRKLKRLIPISDVEAKELASMPLTDRRKVALHLARRERFAVGGTAEDRRLMRNARKRERQAR